MGRKQLYGSAKFQRFPLSGVKWVDEMSQFNDDFIKNYNDDRNMGFCLEVEVQYLEKLHELHNHLQFLPERMKTGKVECFLADLSDKKEYVIQIRNLNQDLNNGLVF